MGRNLSMRTPRSSMKLFPGVFLGPRSHPFIQCALPMPNNTSVLPFLSSLCALLKTRRYCGCMISSSICGNSRNQVWSSHSMARIHSHRASLNSSKRALDGLLGRQVRSPENILACQKPTYLNIQLQTGLSMMLSSKY